MQSNAEVTAADIARLAGVGRAAVSNWRKRFADFPSPIGGTPASPTYRLAEVETWLRANDRLTATTPADALWMAIQHAGAQLGSIQQAILRVGQFLLRPEGARTPRGLALPPELRHAITDVTSNANADQIFELLVERYLDVQGGRRGTAVSAAELAQLMVRLVEVPGATVLDPSCGTGWLLREAAAAGAKRVIGQDADADLVALAGLRLGLAGVEHEVRTGSLQDDAFPDPQVEVVLCDPPYGQRDWGHDELTFDTRWEYEVPPRSEPELAWVQHALARLRPGGWAVMLLPPAVASRPAGRRVRNALVRRGALRAIVALPPGAASPVHLPLHLWLLRRPDDTRVPADLLLVDVSSQKWPDCTDLVQRLVASYRGDAQLLRTHADVALAAPLLNVVDDEIDLTPARHLARERPGVDANEVRARRDTLAALIAALPGLLPDPPGEPVGASTARTVAVADLIRTGQVTLHSPTDLTPRVGDVLVPTGAARPRCTVVRDASAVPIPDGPFTVLRPDPERVDPWFLAGFIGRESNLRLISSLGSSRLDIRRARLPYLPFERQRQYGAWFERLDAFDRAVGEVSALSTEVVHLMAEGLASGALGGRP